MYEDILLVLLKTTNASISKYVDLINECPLIQDILVYELYDDKIQTTIKENLKEISIKLIETMKLINNVEFTKNINDLDNKEKRKVLKKLEKMKKI